jgi:hypothetical protein
MFPAFICSSRSSLIHAIWTAFIRIGAVMHSLLCATSTTPNVGSRVWLRCTIPKLTIGPMGGTENDQAQRIASSPWRRTNDSRRPIGPYRPGLSTTLMTPSFLSRNFLYISGASSKPAGWVTTKLGSIFPSMIFSRSGLV